MTTPLGNSPKRYTGRMGNYTLDTVDPPILAESRQLRGLIVITVTS